MSTPRNLVVLLAALLAGCPSLPPPDGCPPYKRRCGPRGQPEICSPEQRWTPADRPCEVTDTVCCLTISAYGNGRELFACVPKEACVPERDPDAGVNADAGDAGPD